MQGRKLLEQENPSLIILDILLPDGNGLSFCDEIREKSDLPILFLSALGENGDIVNGLLRGGDDYLPKPYDLEVLLARVETLLRRAGRQVVTTIARGTLTLNTVSQFALVNPGGSRWRKMTGLSKQPSHVYEKRSSRQTFKLYLYGVPDTVN